MLQADTKVLKSTTLVSMSASCSLVGTNTTKDSLLSMLSEAGGGKAQHADRQTDGARRARARRRPISPSYIATRAEPGMRMAAGTGTAALGEALFARPHPPPHLYLCGVGTVNWEDSA